MNFNIFKWGKNVNINNIFEINIYFLERGILFSMMSVEFNALVMSETCWLTVLLCRENLLSVCVHFFDDGYHLFNCW